MPGLHVLRLGGGSGGEQGGVTAAPAPWPSPQKKPHFFLRRGRERRARILSQAPVSRRAMRHEPEVAAVLPVVPDHPGDGEGVEAHGVLPVMAAKQVVGPVHVQGVRDQAHGVRG